MKSLFTLLLLLSATSKLFAQDYDNRIPYTFEKGGEYYLLADSVNVRKTPSLKGELITQLPIGTRIRILSQSAVFTTLNNYTMYWYEVQFNSEYKGYIWGGKIAKTSFRSTKNPEIVFHFGIDYVKLADDLESIYYQVRVEQKGKAIQKLCVRGFGYPMKTHTLVNHGNRGLQSVDDVLYLEGFAESCGDDQGAEVLIFSSGKLHQVTRLTDFSDVPVFSNDILYFPADMKGIKDRIVLYHESGEWVESEDPEQDDHISYNKQQSTVYKWTGEKLVTDKP